MLTEAEATAPTCTLGGERAMRGEGTRIGGGRWCCA